MYGGMEKSIMRVYVSKLALWYTRTFTPIITHDDLEPIMATLGFISVPVFPNGSAAVVWKEYFYSAAGACHRNHSDSPPPPRPRLPYPRIDGLHIYTYCAFLNAVNFYLDMTNISDLFHVRGMPLQQGQEHKKMWCRMEENDLKFVHCEVSFNLSTYSCYEVNKNEFNSSSSSTECNSRRIRNKGETTPIGCIVPLNDIIG